jgi:hypothetical protein
MLAFMTDFCGVAVCIRYVVAMDEILYRYICSNHDMYIMGFARPKSSVWARLSATSNNHTQ